MRLLNSFFTLSRYKSKAKELRENNEARKSSAQFAIRSMAFSVLIIGLSALGAFLLTLIGESLVLTIMFGAFGFAFLAGAAISMFWSLVSLVFQFTVTRNVWSWIALVMFLAAIAAAAVVIWHFAGNISF